MTGNPSGPLSGLRVLEFAGLGPGPHCAMLLADLGAEVVRIDRAGGNGWPNPVTDRGRSQITLDIRTEEGKAFCLDAADHADVEGGDGDDGEADLDDGEQQHEQPLTKGEADQAGQH